MRDEKYDILIYLSDQHTADIMGAMGDPVVRTPNLDRIAGEAAVFENAYTSCPLCVPARASFMTGRYPSKIGVFGNDDAFSSQEPTFVHSLSANGYETVLCGRMHFVGEDQRHGFKKRIAGDISPNYWGNPSERRKDLGDFGRTLYQKYCLEIIGMGDSPVLAYDRYVTETALEYLKENHASPQMILVGTYGPHFPYMAPEEKFLYYQEKLKQSVHEEHINFGISAVASKQQETDAEDLVNLRAAYYGMIEVMDEQIGEVCRAFQAYLDRNGRKGIFVYLSDHGDQIGVKKMFGKQTFFEYSSKIPLLIRVQGIEGKRIREPVSIMDVGPTLCGLTDSMAVPLSDGVDQSRAVYTGEAYKRPVISEFYEPGAEGRSYAGTMVRSAGCKFITYDGYESEDLLFDLEADPKETVNIINRQPKEADRLRRAAADKNADLAAAYKKLRENQLKNSFLNSCGACYPEKNRETWLAPEECRTAKKRFKLEKYKRK